MPVSKREVRWLLVPGFLAAQALLIGVTAGVERPPAPPDLERFPVALDGWVKAWDDPVAGEVAAQLKADRVLSRTYLQQSTRTTAGLFVAWFQSQRSGDRQPHSPKVCLPGSGWEPRAVGETTFETAAGPITVNRYIVANRNQRLAILYWYQTPRRVIAGEWAAKILLVADAVRDRRSDTALVRVVVPVGGGRDDDAVATAVAFSKSLYPRLRDCLPR